MNPTISLVNEVEVATKVVNVVGVAAAYGAATMIGATAVDGACHPMGILWQLRLQVSPHHCRSNEETGLMDHW